MFQDLAEYFFRIFSLHLFDEIQFRKPLNLSNNQT